MNEFEIYVSFRKAQANALNRPFKLPKDWNNYFENKLKPEQRESLRKMSRYSNTTWINIDIDKYFKYGFELWKNFSYHQFFKLQLINYYKDKELNLRRVEKNIKKDFIESAKFVKLYNRENNIKSLKDYASLKDGFYPVIINHFVQGKISKYLVVYCLLKRYFVLDDAMQSYISRIMEEYRTIRNSLTKNLDFFEDVDYSLTRS